MPKRTSDHGKHNRTPLLGGLKDSMNALAADLGLSKPKKHDTNPFGDALRETSERKGGIIDELTRHAVALSPVIKRRTFPELENVPEGLVLGWAQLPSTRGRGFSLGIFPDRDHFAQVAFADTHGRVFVGTDPNMDVQDMQARFMFGKEKEVTLPDGERLGESGEPRSRSGFSRAGHGLGSALHHGRGLGRGLGHGADGVKAELTEKQLPENAINALADFIAAGEVTLDAVAARRADPAIADDLKYVLATANAMAAGRYQVAYCPSLVRGQGYYTGTVFEIQSNQYKGAVGGGGRYDGLIGKFTGENVPAVGFSIGFERIFQILEQQGFAIPDRRKKAAVLCDEGQGADAIRMTDRLRAQGIDASVYLRPKKMGKFLNKLEEQGYDGFLVLGESKEPKWFEK